MEELKSLRQENTKTFDVGGGRSRLEGHIGAIHYKNNYANLAEAWKDIDLTWVNNQILTAPYDLTRNGQQYTFKDKKTSEVSTIELISVTPVGIPFEIIPWFSRVRFQHILPNDKIPFEAQFQVTGKVPITRAFDDEGELELETNFVGDVLTERLLQVRDKQTGNVRPAKGQIRIDPTWEIGAGTDDCRRALYGNLWSLTHSQFIAGAAAGNWQYGSGGRFTNITIAQGATISSAYFTVRAEQTVSATVVRTRISAEDVDDAITFADDAAAFDTRWAGRTTARVDWDNIGNWTAGTYYDSPEIKTVIQEIIDRAGWVTGNDIVIFWDDFDDRSDHLTERYRAGESYEGAGGYAPRLVITYTTVTFIPKVYVL